MGERRGTKALELWCRRITDGYPGVKIENMTTSWRDGLAFCAMIHKFRPDLIDFKKLNKNDVYHNNELAFRTAERHLGIPALLDAEDMVEFPVPDRLSILTYLSQFYQVFVGSQGTPTRIVPKRPANTAGGIVSPASPSPAKKMAVRSGSAGGIGRREPCLKCGMPVFLAERLNVGQHLYHRTCFRCARCNNQLSLANYYETETDGQYSCEICPDEEAAKIAAATKKPTEEVAKKSAIAAQDEGDSYSTEFETALELPLLSKTETMYSNARSQFISQIVEEQSAHDEDDKPPDLPKSKPPDATADVMLIVRQDSNKTVVNSNATEDDDSFSFSGNPLVHSTSDLKNNQPKTARETATSTPGDAAIADNVETKDVILNSSSNSVSGNDTNNTSSSSLVKARMKLFDGSSSPARDCNSSDAIKASAPPNIAEKPEDAKISSTNKVPSAEELVVTRLIEDKQVADECNRSDLNASCNDVDLGTVQEKNVDLRSHHDEIRENASIDDAKLVLEEISDNIKDSAANVADSNKDDVSMICSFKEELSDISDVKKTNESLHENQDTDYDNAKSVEILSSNDAIEIMDTSESRDKLDITECSDAQSEDNISKVIEESNSKEVSAPITISSSDSQNESSAIIDSSNVSASVEIPTKTEDSAVISISSDSQSVNVSDKTSGLEESAIAKDDSVITISSDGQSMDVSDKLSELEESPKGGSVFMSNDDSGEAAVSNSSTLEKEVNVKKDVPQNLPEIELTTGVRKVSKENEYPDDLNPFDEDDGDDDAAAVPHKPVPAKRKIKPHALDAMVSGLNQDTPEELKTLHTKRLPSMNPFGDSGDEDDDVPEAKQKTVLKAPKISFNPFWSDGEEPEDEEETKGKPKPTPRTSRNVCTPEAKPRVSNLSAGSHSGGFYGSSSSISSLNSSLGHTPGRKKKPAPPPPPTALRASDAAASSSAKNSQSSSPTTSVQSSPKSLRHRKTRKAPPPPTSTPMVLPMTDPYASITSTVGVTSPPFSPVDSPQTEDAKLRNATGAAAGWEIEKDNKDETNRNRQSQGGENGAAPDDDRDNDRDAEDRDAILTPDKSTYGKWKRKKGPAPARPVLQRRSIKAMPIEEVRKQLDIIELQQQGLEKQGVRLEQIIRDRCETANIDPDTATDPDVEDLVLQLFELVNEKNELFRKQAELMYLRRQQRLEEEHADLEYQIRCLMEKPENNKPDSDKAREEELIKRLVDVVERRNEIIECLEMDRVRENQEDDSISSHLTQLALKREEESLEKSMDSVKIEEKQKEKDKKKDKKKEKKFKLKSSSKVDADKDIDESESSSATDTMKKKKKKWFS